MDSFVSDRKSRYILSILQPAPRMGTDKALDPIGEKEEILHEVGIPSSKMNRSLISKSHQLAGSILNPKDT